MIFFSFIQHIYFIFNFVHFFITQVIVQFGHLLRKMLPKKEMIDVGKHIQYWNMYSVKMIMGKT